MGRGGGGKAPQFEILKIDAKLTFHGYFGENLYVTKQICAASP